MKKYIIFDQEDFWFVLHYPKLHLLESFKIEDASQAYEAVKELKQFDLVKILEEMPESFKKQSNGLYYHKFALAPLNGLQIYELK
ncbi:MAG: hypothetical protein ACO1OQ_12840 [Rufibacter sp.]